MGRNSRALSLLLVGLWAGLSANALLGPLAVVAPLSLGFAILVRRGNPVAPVVALGPGLYTAYMFPQ